MREGWELKKLGDVCEKTKNINWKENQTNIFKYIDLSAVSRDTLAVIESTDIDFSNAPSRAKKLIKINDIIFATTRPTLNRMAVISSEYDSQICSTGFTVLRPKKDEVESKYIFYSLQIPKFMQRMEKMQRGASYPAVSDKDVKDFQIPIPPLPEQKQIVTLLDQAFGQIDLAKAKLEQNLHNAKELLTSYMQNKFQENVSGSNSISLNEICDLIVDCEHKTAPTQTEGYPSIRTPNIGFGTLLLDGVNRVSEDTYKEWTRRAIPQEDDLILAREAPAGNIGVIPKDAKVCLGQRTVLIRPKKDIFVSKYLAYLILSKDVQESLLSHSKGATVGHINMKDIRAFKIYNLPSISEQELMVADIENIYKQTQTLQAHYQQKLNNLEELKKSILEKAFKGEFGYRG